MKQSVSSRTQGRSPLIYLKSVKSALLHLKGFLTESINEKMLVTSPHVSHLLPIPQWLLLASSAGIRASREPRLPGSVPPEPRQLGNGAAPRRPLLQDDAWPQASLQTSPPINKHCSLRGLENAGSPHLQRRGGGPSAASCKFLCSSQSPLNKASPQPGTHRDKSATHTQPHTWLSH